MRKFLILTLVIFLALLASASATNMVSNPMANSTFNYGDQIVITGQIGLVEDAAGATVEFSAYSEYLSQRVPVATKIYSFLADIPITFSHINKGALVWAVTDSVNTSDDWRIEVDISKGPAELATLKSNKFTISNKLFVEHSANSNLFNFGEPLEFSGTVLDARGVPARGSALISLEELEAGNVLTDTVPLENGYLSYSYTFKPTDPTGSYTLSVEFTDENGNTGSASVNDLAVTNRLEMVCSMQKLEVPPGGIAVAYGSITDAHGDPIGGLNITSWITDPGENKTLKYSTFSDANGNYGFEVPLGEQAVPGTYTVRVGTEDQSGNEGSCGQSFTVKVTKRLLVSLASNTSSSYIGETIDLRASLENKGNVDLSGTVNFFMDSHKVAFEQFTLGRGQSRTITTRWSVPEDPGNHTLKTTVLVDGERLAESEEIKFTILEQQAPTVDFDFIWIVLLLLVVIVVAAFLFTKRQEIKEHFWHREFKKSFRKRRH